MSMITDIIFAVSNAERQIDDQISKLQSYQKEINDVQQRITAAFSGSTTEYGTNMLDKLSQTEQQVSDTISRLQYAKEKLITLKMI